MSDLFVYYRVRSDTADRLRPQIAALQSSLVQRFGIRASLKRRPEEKDGLQTWMEVYESVPDEFLSALTQAAMAARLPIEGERHHEIFEDLPECA